MLPQVDVVEVVDRTVEALANRLGRCPTVDEVVDAAGVGPDEVLTALEAARPLAVDAIQEALRLRCVEGLDRDAIADRMRLSRLQVSWLLRAAGLSQGGRRDRTARPRVGLRRCSST